MWRSIQLRPVEVVVVLLLLDRIYTVTLVATRFSFGHHVTVGIFFYIFLLCCIPFFFSFPIYFSVERKHSDSGDQSGRLCAFSFSYFYVCDAKIVNLETWNAAAEVKIMDVLNVG